MSRNVAVVLILTGWSVDDRLFGRTGFDIDVDIQPTDGEVVQCHPLVRQDARARMMKCADAKPLRQDMLMRSWTAGGGDRRVLGLPVKSIPAPFGASLAKTADRGRAFRGRRTSSEVRSLRGRALVNAPSAIELIRFPHWLRRRLSFACQSGHVSALSKMRAWVSVRAGATPDPPSARAGAFECRQRDGIVGLTHAGSPPM